MVNTIINPFEIHTLVQEISNNICKHEMILVRFKGFRTKFALLKHDKINIFSQ